MKQLFFYIKILVLGLNPEDYYFYIFSGLYGASNHVNIRTELAQLLLNHLNVFACKVFTRNILEVFIFKRYRKEQNIEVQVEDGMCIGKN